MYVHVTRSQLELKQARCKISNKGYLSLNIYVILCHNKKHCRKILTGPGHTHNEKYELTLANRYPELINHLAIKDKILEWGASIRSSKNNCIYEQNLPIKLVGKYSIMQGKPLHMN